MYLNQLESELVTAMLEIDHVDYKFEMLVTDSSHWEITNITKKLSTQWFWHNYFKTVTIIIYDS